MEKNSTFGSFNWEIDPFDSEILERKTCKILDFFPSDAMRLAEQMIESLSSDNIEYATYKLQLPNMNTVQSLEAKGFKIVDVSIKLGANNINLPEATNGNIREATESDILSLQKLASSAFSGTRYYNDPLIKDKASSIYSEWIRNSILKIAADHVLIWEEQGQACGFVAFKNDGRILLIAVDENQRGKGVGKSLVKAALSALSSTGVTSYTVETQLTNTPAIRTYLSCGFNIASSYLTLRWAPLG